MEGKIGLIKIEATFEDGELDRISVVAYFATTASDGRKKSEICIEVKI